MGYAFSLDSIVAASPRPKGTTGKIDFAEAIAFDEGNSVFGPPSRFIVAN
jgi:hypothetical protein